MEHVININVIIKRRSGEKSKPPFFRHREAATSGYMAN